MAAFVVYDPGTGEITRYGYCQNGLEGAQAGAGEAAMLNQFVPDATPDLYYVAGGAVVLKPAMGATINKTLIAADNVDVATISAVPTGATLYLNGVRQGVINDGTVQFGSGVLGFYTLRLEATLRRAQEFTVAAGSVRLGRPKAQARPLLAAVAANKTTAAAIRFAAVPMLVGVLSVRTASTELFAPAPRLLYTLDRPSARGNALPPALSIVTARPAAGASAMAATGLLAGAIDRPAAAATTFDLAA